MALGPARGVRDRLQRLRLHPARALPAREGRRRLRLRPGEDADAFQSACTKFTVLEQLGEEESDDAETQAKGGREQVPTADLKGNSGLVRLLRSAIKAAAGEDGWASVQQVGQQIRNQSSLDWRNYGYSTLTKLLTASELFDLRDEGTPTVAVRDPRASRG